MGRIKKFFFNAANSTFQAVKDAEERRFDKEVEKMLNQIVLVGRLTQKPEVKEGKTIITLKIPRSYKNAEGEYDADFVDCRLYDNIANNAAEYCDKDDIVGVKGRIQVDHIGDTPQIIVEKLTFLSSNKKD